VIGVKNEGFPGRVGSHKVCHAFALRHW